MLMIDDDDSNFIEDERFLVEDFVIIAMKKYPSSTTVAHSPVRLQTSQSCSSEDCKVIHHWIKKFFSLSKANF